MIICPACQAQLLDEHKCNSYCHENIHAEIAYLAPHEFQEDTTPQMIEQYQNTKCACCSFSEWRVYSFRVVTEVQSPSITYPEIMKMKGLTDQDLVGCIAVLVMYSSDIELYKKGKYEFKV